MALSTLSGTQWRWNDSIPLDHEFSFSIDAITSPPMPYRIRRIYCSYNSRYDYYSLNLTTTGGSVLKMVGRSGEVDSWYKNIVIYGGEGATSPELISFFENNATQVTDVIYKAFSYAFKQTADAIRSKGGTTDAITWAQNGGFSSAVSSIVIGKDGQVFPQDMVNGVVAYAKDNRVVGSLQNASGVSF